MGEKVRGGMNGSHASVIEVRLSQDGDVLKKTGTSLRELRKLSGWTQAEMAKRLKVSRASISRVENGGGDVRVSILQKYVESLGGTLRVAGMFPADDTLPLHMLDAFEVEFDTEHQLVFSIFEDDVFRPNHDVVLSIRPQYTSRILAGEKTVELRRRFPVSAPKGTIAYIYSTSPVCAMVGHAEIAGVDKLDIGEIWKRYADDACIERAGFDSYFEGLDRGFALELANVRPFKEPLSLPHLREQFGFEPPQSFLYAKQNLRRALRYEHTIVSH